MGINERILECDVLVIGGGLAGSFAAIKAKEKKHLNVILVDKGYMSRSGGSSFAGGFSALFKPEAGHDYQGWKNRAVKTGEYLVNQDWIDLHLQNSWARYQQLIEWGAPFFEDENGKVVEFSVGYPLTNVRLLSQKFMPVIREKALQGGVQVVDRVMVTDLLKQDGRVVGAVGFHTRDGDFLTFKAKATVVATGQGTFKAPGYPHDYWTADGESMCYRAGLGLTSREFGQQCEYIYREYPSLFSVHRPSKKIVNAEGELFEKRYYISDEVAQNSPDRFHKSQMFEAHAGRGPIYEDCTELTSEEKEIMAESEKQITRMYVRKRLGHDLSQGKHEILWGSSVGATGPAAGGVEINTKCETELPGLYVAGDSAGTNLCGALYIAVGFGLTTAVVSGHIAGENAAKYSETSEKPAVDNDQISGLKEIMYTPLNRAGGFRSSWVTQMLQNTMTPYYIMGIKREDRMQAALTLIGFIQEHLVPLQRAEDPHELRMANEVRNMALNAEMVLRASLFRTESRGLHYREDYPFRDDENWLAWTVLKEEDGQMKLHKKPIPEEWRPDSSLSYEEKYDFRFLNEIIK